MILIDPFYYTLYTPLPMKTVHEILFSMASLFFMLRRFSPIIHSCFSFFCEHMQNYLWVFYLFLLIFYQLLPILFIDNLFFSCHNLKLMRPINDLIKDTVKIYADNWVFLIKSLLVSIALVLPLILGFIPPIAAGIGAIFVEQKIMMLLLAAIFFLVFIILAIIIGSWSQAFVYQAIYQAGKGEPLPIKEMLKIAWPRWSAYFLANLLSGFFILIGFIFLIIPGIVFMIWFFFIPFVVVIEKMEATQSLKRSKVLVSNHFLGVLGRLVLIFIISLLVGSVVVRLGLVGPIVHLLLSPLWMIASYLIYADLAKAKAA